MLTLKYLRDIYEQEKRSMKLQKIDNNFLKDIEEYISLKQKIASKSTLKGYHILKEIENFKTLLRMIFEKREQKIISLALKHVRYKVNVDTSIMLPHEIEFFNKLIKLIEKNDQFFNMLLNKEIVTTKIDKPTSEDSINNEVLQKEDNKNNGLLKVEVIEHIPSFLGENYEFYGPYDKGQQIFLPPTIANILIKVGKVKKL